MLDESFPLRCNLSRSAFPRGAAPLFLSPSNDFQEATLPAPATASVQPSLFDQSELTNAAARLVEAARRAGADAADAVAVRSIGLSVEVGDRGVAGAERAGR